MEQSRIGGGVKSLTIFIGVATYVGISCLLYEFAQDKRELKRLREELKAKIEVCDFLQVEARAHKDASHAERLVVLRERFEMVGGYERKFYKMTNYYEKKLAKAQEDLRVEKVQGDLRVVEAKFETAMAVGKEYRRELRVATTVRMEDSLELYRIQKRRDLRTSRQARQRISRAYHRQERSQQHRGGIGLRSFSGAWGQMMSGF